MSKKTENRRVNLYINGKEVQGSLRQIQADYKKLVAEQKNMVIGSRQYNAQVKKIAAVKAVLDRHYQAVNQTAGAWARVKKAASGINQYLGVIMATTAALTGMIMAFRKAADASMLFEERLDNLSALTGLEGAQLDWLAHKAKETSVAIVASGKYAIRIKQSASDILDAYTKMGSQRPELLANKEALHETTLNAIILSEAAKGKLEPSVAALANTLNQFTLHADESARVINIISAGSKSGAADIEYISTAIEKAGTTMALMGMEVEQGVAIIEAVAPRFAQASQAGNSLDKVLLKMKTNNIGYVNGVFDMNKALSELRFRFNNGEKAVDIFGERHAKMVEVMVQRQSEFNRYLHLVTDTEIALEQAAKNTDNRATKLAQAKNKITLLAIELGDNLSPALTKAYTGFGSLMKITMAIPRIYKENKILIIALTGAVLAYNAQLIANIGLSAQTLLLKYRSIAVDKLTLLLGKQSLIVTNARAIAARTMALLTGKLTIAQGRAIVAQKTLNATIKANPLMLLIVGITAVITALRLYDRYNAANIKREKIKKQTINDLTTANDTLKQSYDAVSTIMSKFNRLSFQEKLDLQSKIDSTLDLAEAELLLFQAKQKAISQDSFRLTTWDMVSGYFKSLVTGMGNTANQATDLSNNYVNAMVSNSEDATQAIDEQITAMLENIQNLKGQKTSISDILNAESNADQIGTDTLIELEEKLSLYELALRNAVKGSEDYLRITQKIAQTQQDINSFGGDFIDPEAAQKLAAERERIEQQLADSIKQIRRQLHLDELSEKDKEIRQVDYKYDDLIAKADQYGLDIMVLTQLREEEVMAIVSKYALKTAAEKQKAQDAITEILMSDREKAVHETTKKYQQLIALAEEHGLESAELYAAMAAELQNIKDQSFSDEESPRDIFGLTAEQWDSVFSNLQAAIQIAQQFGDIWSSVNDKKTAEENAAMTRYEDDMASRKELLEKQLASGFISQKQYNNKVEAIDAQLDKKKKDLAIKQWKRDKELRLFSAIINTAAGITQALGSMPPPASFIMAALTAVLGGVQIAAISSESPPAFRYGGFTPDRPTMAMVGDGYKKEWVASGDLVSDPYAGPVIQQLEEYQRGRGRFRFSNPIQPDFHSISSSPPSFNPSGSPSSDDGMLSNIFQQMLLMNENNTKMNDFLSDPQNRKSTLSYDHFTEYAKELEDIQSLSRTVS